MRILLSIFLIVSFIFSYGQGSKKAPKSHQKIEKQTLFGIQVSPIIPANFLQKTNYTYESDTANFSIKNQNSLSYGVEIRHYFTYKFAINTGIMYTNRNIDVDFSSQYPYGSKGTDTSFTRELKFIAFEIPIKVSGYVRLSDYIYMSIGGGINLNFYPSDIRVDNVYMQRSEHLGLNALQFFQVGFSANIGWEFRTKENGIFYLGAGYQAQIDNMAYILFFEKETIHRPNYFEAVNGSYLSIDIKYFFPFNSNKKHR